MADQIYPYDHNFHRNQKGIFTCCKAVTWDRRLYFPSNGWHAEDFIAQKIQRLWLGLNP
jgi:hypothetical protein